MKHSETTNSSGERGLWPVRRSDRTGWHLTPEGAAVHLGERAAVVADVHLGYEWARGVRGDVVPAHSLRETVEKLSALMGRVAIARLIVAGDLLESRRPCFRARRDETELRSWLKQRGVELEALQGNHDPPGRHAGPLSMELGGWTIAHGHRAVEAKRVMIGHHHPALRAEGLTAPCFLLGRSKLVLPAFSGNAAGLDVSAARLPEGLRDTSFRLVAALDGLLLDFGALSEVRRRMAGVE